MRVDVLTLFPEAFRGPLDVSIIQRAREAGLLDLAIHDIRSHATDRHKSVDDYPFGGGQGMVMRVDVLDRALDAVAALAEGSPYVIYLTPQGERLDDRLVRELAQHARLALVCGRYEGVDERFVEHRVDREVSIGDYILTGGELPAMVLIDAVTRHVPGALGDAESPEEESFSGDLLEFPHYTRPAAYRGWEVPRVLLEGNHAAIARWRSRQRQLRTARRRPALLPAEGFARPPVKAAGAAIRTFAPADLAGAHALLARLAPALDAGALFATGRDPDLVLVAEARQEVVGVAIAGWDGRVGLLHAVVVRPPFDRRGLEGPLLAELEERLRLKGCIRVINVNDAPTRDLDSP